MEKVFILHHERPETDKIVEDVKLIGAYSTEEAALAAIARLVVQPGFRDYPDHFSIDSYPIDMDHWTEGFVVV